MRRQRCREAVRTPRMRATVVGDSPCSTNSTARRRRRSSSEDVPLGLMLYYTHVQREGIFLSAGVSNLHLLAFDPIGYSFWHGKARNGSRRCALPPFCQLQGIQLKGERESPPTCVPALSRK